MKNVEWSYFDKFVELTNKYMPNVGEGETVASQIVTAISKLVYKWYNDGDVYDNTKYLQGWCNDLSSYANWLRENADAGDILDKVFQAYTDAEYEHILKDLAIQYLNKETLERLEKVEKVGSIYKCEGPYKFVDYYDDDYDEDE